MRKLFFIMWVLGSMVVTNSDAAVVYVFDESDWKQKIDRYFLPSSKCVIDEVHLAPIGAREFVKMDIPKNTGYANRHTIRCDTARNYDVAQDFVVGDEDIYIMLTIPRFSRSVLKQLKKPPENFNEKYQEVMVDNK